MNTLANFGQRVARPVLFIAGLVYLLSGLWLLLAPASFYEVVAEFPPFNRHFLVDLGAFNLPLGIGLLVAARNPAGHRLLVGIAALASVLHAGSHAYDDWLATAPPMHWLLQTIPLLVMALLLCLVYYTVSVHPKNRVSARNPVFKR